MNNVNTQEPSRPVAEGAFTKQPAAKTETGSGNLLPTVETTNQVDGQSIQQQQAESPETAPQRVELAVAQLNDYVQSIQRDLRFTVDQDLGRAVVSVIDRTSQEIIRQIPNETALRLARNLKDQADIDNGAKEPPGISGNRLSLINTRI